MSSGKKAKKRMRKAAWRVTQALAFVALESIGTLVGGLMQTSIERGRVLLAHRAKAKAKLGDELPPERRRKPDKTKRKSALARAA